MDWLNDGVGLIVVISSAIIVVLIAVVLSLLLMLRNKIAVQRLNFLGFYAADAETRKRCAECTVGNRSLNEVALSEVGIKNGKVSFNLTALYKQKNNLTPEARVVIEQRSSLRFSLTEEELMGLLIDGPKGKQLKTLRLYAVDLTGTLYEGKIRPVHRLLAELLAREKAIAAGKAPGFAAQPAKQVAVTPVAAEPATEAAPVKGPEPVPALPAEKAEDTAEETAEAPISFGEKQAETTTEQE